MRFREFQITIHGEFDGSADEQQFRQGLVQHMQPAPAPAPAQLTPEPRSAQVVSPESGSAQQQVLSQIDQGTARWAPPLQQHLDVIKQSLMQNFPVTESADAAAPVLSLCTHCGNLLFSSAVEQRLGIRSCEQLQQRWQAVRTHYVTEPSCVSQGQQCTAGTSL